MIIDAFLFFNEFDLLELRLEEMGPFVDYFLVQESSYTFTGETKPLYLREELSKPNTRFEKWMDKIRLTPAYERVPLSDPWREEAFQRNLLLEPVNELIANSTDDNVFVIVSDVDEIIRRDILKSLPFLVDAGTKYCVLDTHYYGVNMRSGINDWPAPFVYNGKISKPSASYDDVRRARFSGPFITNAGWHYSYVMSASKIVDKIKAFSHTEYQTDYFMDEERIEKLSSTGEDIFDRGVKYSKIEIDKAFPVVIQEDPEKWGALFR